MAEAGSTHRVMLDEPGLQALAAALAPALIPPLVIYLQGELGAGKTTFVRALLRGLHHEGPVKSPTYGLMEEYLLDGRSVLHLDLYRLGQPEELEYLGVNDLLDPGTVLLVEWPGQGRGFLPAPDVILLFSHAGEFRELEFQPKSDSGKQLYELWKEISESPLGK